MSPDRFLPETPMRLVLAALAAVALTGVGVAVWLWLAPGSDARLAACRDGAATVGADIGGAFTLTAHDGRTMTERDLITRPTLIYFGYTFCPDFCPVDVANMAEARRLLAERGIAVNAAFISVDPRRDTVDVLRAFVGNIDPDLVGLTGTPEQVREAARAWRVYYATPQGTDGPFYLVDHSTFTYLMAPGIGFLDFFRHGTDPVSMADRVACYAQALQ
jgi:protein SCO1/2